MFFVIIFVSITKIIPPEGFLCSVAATGVSLFARKPAKESALHSDLVVYANVPNIWAAAENCPQIYANLVFQTCISFWRLFQEREFKEMLAVSYLILQACISFLMCFRQGGALLFVPCWNKNAVAHLFCKELLVATFRGQKLNTNFFFLKLLGHPPDIPAKIGKYPAQKFGVPGFWRRTKLFGPTRWRGRPSPHQKISGPKSLGSCSFSLPEFWSRWLLLLAAPLRVLKIIDYVGQVLYQTWACPKVERRYLFRSLSPFWDRKLSRKSLDNCPLGHPQNCACSLSAFEMGGSGSWEGDPILHTNPCPMYVSVPLWFPMSFLQGKGSEAAQHSGSYRRGGAKLPRPANTRF